MVHSAAGGVGSTLVQFGKLADCCVIGVVGRSDKVEYAEQLGADAVIDKSSVDLWKEVEKLVPEGFDIVFDANGVETLRESYAHLASGGKLVVYGFHSMFSKGKGRPNWLKLVWDYVRTPRFNPLTMTNDNHSVMAFNLSYMFGKKAVLEEGMGKIRQLLEGGGKWCRRQFRRILWMKWPGRTPI